MADLVRPADVARLFSGQRLRLAREIRGLSQSDLARDPLVDVTSAAISQFEKPGSPVRPREATVEQFAEALGFPITFFAVTAMPSSRPDGDLDRLDGYGHFRSLRSLTAKQRREALSITQLVRDVVYELAQRVRLPEVAVPRLGAADIQRQSDLDAAAALVRKEWGVADGPIPDVLQLAERHGAVGVRHPIASAAVSAYSVPFPERPVVVMQEWGRRDRDRFSCSHEIGHLALHEPETALASKDLERQADGFASAFLMPADQIREELPATLDWVRFIELKQHWQVSIAALLRRAKDLGVMPEAAYVHGVQTMSARGWRTDEPGDLGAPESPRLLAQAVAVAGIDAGDLAQTTGWPTELIRPILNASADRRPQVSI